MSLVDQLKPFIDAGFGLHWLHPREKRPIGENWQERPVATFDALRRRYVDGNNVGVRLGEFSRVEGGYLHVLDIDIRKPTEADAAWAKLRDLLPGIALDTFPSVISGSGGESRHVYFVTETPFKSKKLAKSDGWDMVFDPSKGRDVKKHHWEIELFGSPKQVAMPPSIHPDSGLPYRWEREFDFDALGFGVVPEIPATLPSAAGGNEDEEDDQPAKTERLGLSIDETWRILNTLSDRAPDYWIEDRDGWREAGMALKHEFGADGYDIWTEFSKRSAKFVERDQKAVWKSFKGRTGRPVRMATLKAAAQAFWMQDRFDELDDLDDEPSEGDFQDSDFDALIGENPPKNADSLSDEEALSKDIDTALPWTSLLAVNKDGDAIVANLHNIELIVKNDPRLVGLAQLNEFTQETVQRTTPGTKSKKRKNAAKETRQLTGRVWQVEDTLNGELWSDDRDFAIRSIIEAPSTQGGYGIKISDRDLKAAVVLAANDHAFHPIREYLSGLTWDGTARVDTLWVDYVGATDDCYHRDVARLALVAAVTRIFEPGHKFDYATILEGLQGKRKSTLIEVLGRRWFAELDGDFHDQKQMVELMQGAWIMEIPELTGFGRADVRSIKAFISRRKDRVRLAYARRAGEFPRQCVFIGSTNDREYLKDDTGGRRFWPVQCQFDSDREIDTELLERNVDQLWAEAVTIYRQMRSDKPVGTLPLYLMNPESRLIAARLQESRRVESADDVMAGRIAEWLDSPIVSGNIEDDLTDTGQPRYRNEVCTAMIWVECLGKDLAAFKTVEQGSTNRAMSKVPGWEPDGSMRFQRYGKQRVFRRGGAVGKYTRAGLSEFV